MVDRIRTLTESRPRDLGAARARRRGDLRGVEAVGRSPRSSARSRSTAARIAAMTADPYTDGTHDEADDISVFI